MRMVEKRYKFFPGCLARVKLPHIEKSVRTVLEAVRVELVDVNEFTCCPDPVVFRSASRLEWLLLAGHNLSLDGGDPILTLCPGCASSLAEASFVLKNEMETARRVTEALKLNHEFIIPQVSHFLKVLAGEEILESIKGMVKRDLSGLRVATHYGCHLVRPSFAVGFDDPEKPKSLDDVVAATGAMVVEYEDKMLCCGRPAIDEETSRAILEHKLECLRDASCDILVVACPFCFEQFDLGQVVLARKKGRDYNLPILYVSQLIEIGMGMSGEASWKYHRIKPHKLL